LQVNAKRTHKQMWRWQPDFWKFNLLEFCYFCSRILEVHLFFCFANWPLPLDLFQLNFRFQICGVYVPNIISWVPES
jgi:hypothetical protein